MDIKDYFNTIYGLYYEYNYLFMLTILDFYRIFGNVFGTVMKKLQNQMVNDKMDQKHEIIIKYQLEKAFMAFMVSYIQNKMVLFGLLLEITWQIYDVVNVFYYRTLILK